MGAIAPINFEKGLIMPIDFNWKHGLKGNLQTSIEIPNGLSGILHPSIEVPKGVPVLYGYVAIFFLWNTSIILSYKPTSFELFCFKL